MDPLPPQKGNMLSGQLYQASDSELSAERLRAQSICHRLNTEWNEDPNDRTAVLIELMGEDNFGDGAFIRPPFHVDYGYNIRIGANTEFNMSCVLLDCAPITIGRQCLFGPGVQLYTATHPTDPKLRREGWELAKPIVIGDNVWVGGGSVVLPGITIGDNAVVGAGSVVTKDVKAGTVVVGNPARYLREAAAPNEVEST